MGKPKLTPEQRREVVARYAAGESSVALGRAYGMSDMGILAVLRTAGVPRRSPTEAATRLLRPDELPEAARSAFDFASQRTEYRPGFGHPVTVILRTCPVCGRQDWLVAKSVRQHAREHKIIGRCLDCLRASGGPLAGRRGEDSPSWRGGTRKAPNGYVQVWAPDHPFARKGCVLEHRLVMEKVLGRYLMPGETVHHKNGVRDDNRPENLEVWAGNHLAGQRLGDPPHCPTCTCGQSHPEDP